MTPELISALAGASLGGGLLTLAIRRTWSDRDNVNQAYAEGRRSGELVHKEQLTEVRTEFLEEIGKLEEHVQRLHRAIVELVKLVPDENMAAAVAILASLSIANPNKETD